MHKVSKLSKITTLLSKNNIPVNTTLLVTLQTKHFSLASLSAPTQEHITHLILEQKSASEALDTFKWASKLPSFTHSHSTYRALIHKLSSFRRFDIVYKLLDEMPHSISSHPKDDIFVTIIRGLGRARMISDVIKVPDLVSKFQKTPSLKIFNSILDVLVKHDIDLAREFYRKKMMRSGVHGDEYTFGILMKGLCVTNRIAEAFKLLQLLKSSDVKPNAVIYNTLLHALCKNGNIGRARSLMNEIENPNDVTFNVLISGYCKENNLVQALVVLEKSFSFGFVPDVITITKVVAILCNAGRVTEAVEVLERVESKGGVVDVVAYNTVIKGCCKLGKVKAGHGFLKEMERKGCLPNVDTYNVLIGGFCGSEMFHEALDMFNEMKSDGINWNFATYDTLIRGFFSGGGIEQGYKILELMEESKGGSRGRISPYNSVLYGLYKKNMWDEALEFLLKMDKLFPRAVDRSLRTLSLCEEGAIEDAKAVYDQMINEGGIPSALVYDCLIHGLCGKGCVREAFELLNEMVHHGFVPVTSTFNALISEFCSQEKDGIALALLEDMVERGCMPNKRSYGPLIDILCRRGNFQKALSIFLQMVEKGGTPDHSMWNSLLSHPSQETSWTYNIRRIRDVRGTDRAQTFDHVVHRRIEQRMLVRLSAKLIKIMGYENEASTSSHAIHAPPPPPLPREDTPLLSNQNPESSQSKTFANILIAIVGAGVLGLPYTFKKTGWLMGSVMIFSVAFLTYHCMMLLVYSRRKLETVRGFSKINSYGDLGFAVCGRVGRVAVDVMIVLAQAGFCVSYLIFIANSLVNMINNQSNKKIFGFLSAKALYIWACFPFQLGLNSIPTLTHLAPLSIFADVVDLGAMGIVIVEDIIMFFKKRPPVEAFGGFSVFFYGLGVCVYAFEGIGMVLPLELEARNKDKFGRALGWCMAIIALIYGSFGLLGYLAFGENTRDIITTNLGKGIISTLVQIGLSVNLFFTFPLMMNPVYEIVERRLCETRYSLWLRWLVVFVVSLVAMLVPNFTDFLSLVGSSVCCALGFVLPTLFHIIVFKGELSMKVLVKDWIILIFGVVAAISGTYTSSLEILSEFN